MERKKVIITSLVVAAVVVAFAFAFNKSRNEIRSTQLSNPMGYGMMDDYLPGAPMMSEESLEVMSESPQRVAPKASEQSLDVPSQEVSEVDKRVIKNGSLTLKVDRASDASEEISKIAKDNGGEVFSSSFSQRNDIKSGNITVKVPVDNFEKTFNEIREVATLVVNESTSGQDVTEQYIDLQARLKNKKVEEETVANLLQRSGDLDDVLKVTTALNRIRGEIESMEAQIKYLESQTDMATIFVSLTEDPEVTVIDSWRPIQIAKDAVNNLIKSAQNFISFAIVLVINIIPVLIIYLIFIWVIYVIGKKIYLKIKNRKQEKQ